MPHPDYPIPSKLPITSPYFAINPANTTDTIDMSLMRILSDGPDVSLNGSPTVSPTTVALWLYGEKVVRATELGQAISYRVKRDEKGWRVFVTTEMMDAPVETDRCCGAIGVDLNTDHLAIAVTDASGN